jgi:hypothetical protein
MYWMQRANEERIDVLWRRELLPLGALETDGRGLDFILRYTTAELEASPGC